MTGFYAIVATLALIAQVIRTAIAWADYSKRWASPLGNPGVIKLPGRRAA